ncbi:hypothetical protein Trydic_g15980 [Trypoxylus dichotomus]
MKSSSGSTPASSWMAVFLMNPEALRVLRRVWFWNASGFLMWMGAAVAHTADAYVMMGLRSVLYIRILNAGSSFSRDGRRFSTLRTSTNIPYHSISFMLLCSPCNWTSS